MAKDKKDIHFEILTRESCIWASTSVNDVIRQVVK